MNKSRFDQIIEEVLHDLPRRKAQRNLERLERQFTHLRWTMIASEVIYFIALYFLLKHFLRTSCA
jgi:RNA polymerase-interacting CarD/CdnL/TRCF family regulator